MEELIHTHLHFYTILASSSSLSFSKNCDSIALTGKNWLSLCTWTTRYAQEAFAKHGGQSCPKLYDQNSFFKAPLHSFHPLGSITSNFNHFHALLCLICKENDQILLLLGFYMIFMVLILKWWFAALKPIFLVHTPLFAANMPFPSITKPYLLIFYHFPLNPNIPYLFLGYACVLAFSTRSPHPFPKIHFSPTHWHHPLRS